MVVMTTGVSSMGVGRWGCSLEDESDSKRWEVCVSQVSFIHSHFYIYRELHCASSLRYDSCTAGRNRIDASTWREDTEPIQPS